MAPVSRLGVPRALHSWIGCPHCRRLRPRRVRCPVPTVSSVGRTYPSADRIFVVDAHIVVEIVSWRQAFQRVRVEFRELVWLAVRLHLLETERDLDLLARFFRIVEGADDVTRILDLDDLAVVDVGGR